MTALLDASCLVAYFRAEPGAAHVSELLRTGVSMSVLNRAEVLNRMGRDGASFAQVRIDIDMLGVGLVAVDSRIADRAAQIRTDHYHRQSNPVSLADCVDRPLMSAYRNSFR